MGLIGLCEGTVKRCLPLENVTWLVPGYLYAKPYRLATTIKSSIAQSLGLLRIFCRSFSCLLIINGTTGGTNVK